jgi:hypothetical protein
MDLKGLFNAFLTAVASGLGTFLAIRAGGWFFDGRKPVTKMPIKKEDTK